jgi:hypothetical protein
VIQEEVFPEGDETFCVWLWGSDGAGRLPGLSALTILIRIR